MAKASELVQKGIEVTLQWVPSHIGIEGNEKADKAAKKAANKSIPQGIERYSSFSHIIRLVRGKKQEEINK
jgi:ribonuclease HI